MQLDIGKRWPQIVVACSAIIVVVGAYGPWGALSLVEEQAEVVDVSRNIIAGLAMIAILSTAAPWLRRYATINAAMALALALIIALGDADYETNQSYQYGVEGPLWGFYVLYIGASLGILGCIIDYIQETRARRASQPPTG